MESTQTHRATLSSKARAFSIAYLVDKAEETDNRQADDKEDNIPTGQQDRDLLARPTATHVNNIQLHLEAFDLWECFYRLGTEMIITRAGRRMFPALRISFTGLVPDEKYIIMLDVVPVDSKRHRYSYPDSAWYVAGEADPAPPKRVHVHPESPFTGEQLMNHTVSFEKVKLTNNRADKNGNIILNSMQKYQPRVHIIQSSKVNDDGLNERDSKTFTFPETIFMAVTAYQNHLITRLKIYSNPFAKGFRDSTRLLVDTERISNQDEINSLGMQIAYSPNEILKGPCSVNDDYYNNKIDSCQSPCLTSSPNQHIMKQMSDSMWSSCHGYQRCNATFDCSFYDPRSKLPYVQYTTDCRENDKLNKF